MDQGSSFPEGYVQVLRFGTNDLSTQV